MVSGNDTYLELLNTMYLLCLKCICCQIGKYPLIHAISKKITIH